MKFSLNFIKEFFDPEKSAKEIARNLTMAGLEIEHIEKRKDDYIFDAEVTSNRYDWLSIFGIATELACLCGRRLKSNLPTPLKKPHLERPEIIIEDYQDCSIYIARLIQDIKAGESPSWLKERVTNCGLNTVSNIVDVTNYCMLKWGNPLHAFDFDKIEGNIYIRRAKPGERFLGLDDKERVLSPANLVISDDKKVIALAGVMGAKNTEVDLNTQNILLEAAVFSPLIIRRSRRAIGIDTDSSYRFERNVSSQLLEIASFEAAVLLHKLCGGILSGYKKSGKAHRAHSKKITFSFSELDDYIGEKFPRKEVKRILKNLGFRVREEKNRRVVVYPPFFRLDIERDVDVFEEVTRVYGYNRIRETIPQLVFQQKKDDVYFFKKELRSFLANLGLNEVVTYSINSEENITVLKEKGIIRLINPLRTQENALRTTLLSGMVEAICHNLNQKNTVLRFFEIANIYKKEERSFSESSHLAAAVTEKGGGFFYLKGIAEEIFKFLNIEEYTFTETNKEAFSNSLKIVYRDRVLGFLGEIDSAVRGHYGLKDGVSFLQIDIKTMLSLRENASYKPFPRFPVVYRDISLSLDKKVKFRELENILKNVASNYLLDYKVIDIYKTKDVTEDFFMFTLRIFYQSKERTLTAREVDDIHSSFRERLSSKEGIALR